MLAPVVLAISLYFRSIGMTDTDSSGKAPPLLPSFVVGFLILAAVNSAGLIPAIVADWAAQLSRWALLVSIAAVGIKTSLARMLEVGGSAIAVIVAETIFIGLFVVGGLHLLGI